MSRLSRGAFGEGEVLRNWWTASLGIALLIVFFLFWLGWSVEVASGVGPEGDWQASFLSTFFPLVWWFLLKASVFTNIKIDKNYAVVRNFFSKSTIPVQCISKVSWEGGVDIMTHDGGRYWCFNLGGSLIGALAGYPTNRRCARRIEKFLADSKGGGSEKCENVRSGAHLNLIFLASSILGSYLFIFLLEIAFS